MGASGEPLVARGSGPIQLGGAGGATRRGLLKSATALGLGAGLAACPCCIGEAQASGNAKFDYGTLSGPISWGGTCSSGMRQSPINIPAKAIRASNAPRQGAACRPAQIDVKGYKSVKPNILNTGVGTMQVNFAKGTQFLTCGGADLELLQFHFHTPSEHAFDGERTAMEAHLVHKNVATGQLSVLGVMLEVATTPNLALAAALKYAPLEARKEAPSPVAIDPKSLLPRPGNWQYVRYTGSLTTPGCSEGVEWYVMLQPATVTPEQVLGFAQYASGGKSLAQNSRPLQPLNGRAFDLQYDCGLGA
ncbi:MAG: alpha type intracellular carbonic anhydrase [Monoraphidium minutum]|nr:MAG: alpha type intracellular carbonic anhydrase [Monoraphidium minutum]